MAGGRFEVALPPQDEPQAFGLEGVELRVAGHAGSTPRALGKVASGGELSRLALAVAVTTSRGGEGTGSAATLIFDEIDAGVGGTVADSVGRRMKELGRSTQVLAVTHLAQVAACADQHFVVSKALQGKATLSDVQPVLGENRVSEIARMLGGERLAGTSRAHAQAMLGSDGAAPGETLP
jgi:DNA repair protein RecN (Recombination protein N)